MLSDAIYDEHCDYNDPVYLVCGDSLCEAIVCHLALSHLYFFMTSCLEYNQHLISPPSIYRQVCSTRSTKTRLQTQHSTLHTPCIWLGIPEGRMWILPHFKIPHSNTWIWCWSLKCRVLINRHKFRAWTQNLWWILRTLHSGFTLHTQDSLIQIHWVLSVECWVSVISLRPGLSHSISDLVGCV